MTDKIKQLYDRCSEVSTKAIQLNADIEVLQVQYIGYYYEMQEEELRFRQVGTLLPLVTIN